MPIHFDGLSKVHMSPFPLILDLDWQIMICHGRKSKLINLPHKAKITVKSEAAGNRTETLNSSIWSKSTEKFEKKKKFFFLVMHNIYKIIICNTMSKVRITFSPIKLINIGNPWSGGLRESWYFHSNFFSFSENNCWINWYQMNAFMAIQRMHAIHSTPCSFFFGNFLRNYTHDEYRNWKCVQNKI